MCQALDYWFGWQIDTQLWSDHSGKIANWALKCFQNMCVKCGLLIVWFCRIDDVMSFLEMISLIWSWTRWHRQNLGLLNGANTAFPTLDSIMIDDLGTIIPNIWYPNTVFHFRIRRYWILWFCSWHGDCRNRRCNWRWSWGRCCGLGIVPTVCKTGFDFLFEGH